ncbi:MAG: NifB/NifX family molybdenum-iron cluster-binding protein [Spirochaetota bacterium]
MIVCLTTAGTGDATLDERFGRAGAFVFVDTENGASREIANGYAGGASGVGAQVAQFIVNEGAEAVITGQVGPSAFRVLEAAAIPAYTTSARTVSDALEELRAGSLERAGAPTGPGHHGRRS